MPVTFDNIMAASDFFKILSAVSLALAYNVTASKTFFVDVFKSFAISIEELPISANCVLETFIV